MLRETKVTDIEISQTPYVTVKPLDDMLVKVKLSDKAKAWTQG